MPRPTPPAGQRTGRARPFAGSVSLIRDRIQRSQVSRSGHMPKNHKKNLTRSLAAGLAVCAIAPGTALAMPAIGGPLCPGAAAGSASNPTRPRPRAAVRASRGRTTARWTTARQHQTGSRGDGAAKQALRSDQADGRATGGTAAPGPPQWPVNPQPIAKAAPGRDGGRRRTTAASTPASGSPLGQPRSRWLAASASRVASACGPAASISRHSAAHLGDAAAGGVPGPGRGGTLSYDTR